MTVNRKKVARRKLLNIMPRAILESMSGMERPHMATKTELVAKSAERWDENLVRDFLEQTFERASGDEHIGGCDAQHHQASR